MKTTTSAFTSKMADSLRSYVPRMTINGTAIVGDVKELTINLGSCGADNSPTGGVVFVPSFVATIQDCATSLQDKEINLELGLVLDNGSVEYIPMGYFTVDKPSVSKYETSITAYGRLMSKMGGTYDSALTYPATIQNIVSEIATKSGVTIDYRGFSTEKSLTIASKMGMISYREALGNIAGLMGGYVTEDANGHVVICKYTNTVSTTIDTSKCYEYPVNYDSTWEVTGIKVVVPQEISDDTGDEESEQQEVSFTYGDPINVTYSNAYMTAQSFEAVKTNLMNYEYMPCEVQFLGDIRLEPWDSIKVTDGASDSGYTVPCMSIMHVWDGGVITTVTAPANTTAQESGNFTGALTKAVEEVRAEVGRFGSVIADKVTTKVLNSEELRTQTAEIADATVQNARIDFAKIDNVRIKDAQIESINGSKIADGTIVASALSNQAIQTIGGNKVFYQANAPTGTFKEGDTWYKTVVPEGYTGKILFVWDGSQWVGSDYDGKIIRANTITAQEIASKTITANEVNMDNLQTKLARIGNKESKHIVLNDDEIDFNNMELTHTKITPSGVSFAYENFIISYDDAEGKTHIHVRAKDGSGRWEAGEALVVAQPVSTVVPESDYVEALSTETYIDEIIYENSFVKIKFDQSLPVTYIVNRLNGILGDRFKAQKNYVYSLDASGDFPRVVFNCDVETTESIFAKGLKTTGNAIVGGTLKATGNATLDSNLTVGGNGTISGTLKVGGHNQEIGYSNSDGGTKSSVSSGATFSNMTSFTLSEGTWMLVGQVYGNIASGKRFGSTWALDRGSGAENFLASRNIISTGASGNHATQSILLIRLTATATAYLRAFHTNGSSISLDWAWRLVRIA